MLAYSEWSLVRAGVLQGIKLGHWLYILMINDLNTVIMISGNTQMIRP